jgi:SulP family sulfate permease
MSFWNADHFRFNRLELAGSLGDLGTLLPLALGMILINGLDPVGLFVSIGLFYIAAGLYFGVTVPVQPMKVIGAYAVATGLSALQITAAGLLMALFLLVIGASGAMGAIGRMMPRAVVRGVQLSTGVLLIREGVKLIMGMSRVQTLAEKAEPFLTFQSLGPLPIGLVIGVGCVVLAFLLIDNQRLPGGLVVVAAGLLVGIAAGQRTEMTQVQMGLYLPTWLPFGWPAWADFSGALILMVLPQIPMTIGNAVVAYGDLSHQYFGEEAKRITPRAACLSMAGASFFSALVGGMPLCHGAGGLAAHYRFGARTAGSNLMIGMLLMVVVLFLGPHTVSLLHLLPLSVLGVLLLFAGSELAMTMIDLQSRKELFVAVVMVGITLALNLAVAFVVGIVVAAVLKSSRFNV